MMLKMQTEGTGLARKSKRIRMTDWPVRLFRQFLTQLKELIIENIIDLFIRSTAFSPPSAFFPSSYSKMN